ncbi:MAG: nicotinate (nicotinamide) nucleotide adenylyltransferase [Bdellovibrionales bacterium]|nr:nicotinate (nicotinamide) nucleotide adenylyltransferase [Bdellovibrionales bacterium]
MKIGFFGGTFNPPHLGHLLAATYALKTFDLDQVWFAPVFHHPFGKHSIPFEHRLAMCKLLIAELSPPFLVTDIEKEIAHEGKTYFTLKELQKRFPENTFSLVIGSDLQEQIKKWSHYNELQEEFTIHFVPRGEKDNPTSIPNISSTNVRADAYDTEIIKNVVTPEIHAYMEKNKFYDK